MSAVCLAAAVLWGGHAAKCEDLEPRQPERQTIVDHIGNVLPQVQFDLSPTLAHTSGVAAEPSSLTAVRT